MNKNKSLVKLSLLCVSLCWSVSAMAQTDSLRMAEYEAFKRKALQEYADFRDKANAEYAQFMRDAWAWYRGEKPIPKPDNEEPIVPPVILPKEDRDKIPEERPVPLEVIIPVPAPAPIPQPILPIQHKPEPVEEWLELLFYGTTCRVRFTEGDKIYLKSAQENDVADMWEQLSSSNYNNLLLDCAAIRKDRSLCDWAYVKFIECIAAEIYGQSYSNESILLQAFVLNQSGFKIRLARSDKGQLHMLIASECGVYGYPYWELDNEHYYLFDGSKVESLQIYTNAFPNEQPLRMTINQENRFAELLSPERILKSEKFPDARATLAVNKNLIKFYNGYPASYLNNDPTSKWRFYAQTPLSQAAQKRLYPVLQKAIAGKSEQEAANLLLNFVQTAFVYEFDDKVWGGDRAFFADETLYYPYSDCEDRAILFSRLIRDLMGLDVVLVYYPGHLAAAVCFKEHIPGDYLNVNGMRYLVCDPTYIHAPIGKTMPDMDNKKAVIVML